MIHGSPDTTIDQPAIKYYQDAYFVGGTHLGKIDFLHDKIWLMGDWDISRPYCSICKVTNHHQRVVTGSFGEFRVWNMSGTPRGEMKSSDTVIDENAKTSNCLDTIKVPWQDWVYYVVADSQGIVVGREHTILVCMMKIVVLRCVITVS